MRLQCCAGPVDHSRDITTRLSDSIGWHHAADHAQHGIETGLDVTHAVEDVISLPLAAIALVDVTGHNQPRATCRASGTACNYPPLCYKGVGQPLIQTKLFQGKSIEVSSTLA
jgi:hypothetical protein